MSSPLISLRNLEKSYPQGVGRSYVLRRIDVDIKVGEFVSIMGPSGAGKSTLLHILGMHDAAWSGEYYFLDQPVHRIRNLDLARQFTSESSSQTGTAKCDSSSQAKIASTLSRENPPHRPKSVGLFIRVLN